MPMAVTTKPAPRSPSGEKHTGAAVLPIPGVDSRRGRRRYTGASKAARPAAHTIPPVQIIHLSDNAVQPGLAVPRTTVYFRSLDPYARFSIEGVQMSAVRDRIEAPTFVGRWGITPRRLRIALGVLWILDAALQYQPRMWGHEFVSAMISPMAAGQPAPVAWVINTAAHLIAPDPGAWNFLFATLQLAIGAGLLVPRTVKPALIAMFFWCAGVWWIGEGLGQILTAHTSPLTGAPGAVLVYALIGILIWPSRDTRPADGPEGEGWSHRPTGFASAPGAYGPLGARAVVGAWAGLWSLFAVLWLLPANRARTSIHDSLAGMAAGEPGWYAHFLQSVAGHFSSGGAEWAWVFAIASLVIGLGPLLARRVVGFFVAGAVLELAFWVTGQAVGGVLTGMGTDPNVGPVVVLLALAAVPAAVEVRVVATGSLPHVGRVLQPRALGARLLASKPIVSGAVGAGIAALLLLAATYPAASAGSSGSVMADMPGMQPTTTAHASGSTSAMPGMATPATSGGSMAGMSANPLLAPEAMGGTDPTWQYLGPALPPSEVMYLNVVSEETDNGHDMQTPTCTTTPTAQQLEYAVRLVQDTSADVAQYADLGAARAAGYIPVTSPGYPVVHYVKLAYMTDQDVLDPSHVDSLVYARTPYGPVLAAAMYLMPRVGELGPMPAGCMLQWHSHGNLCRSNTTGLIAGFSPCPPNTTPGPTPVMSHV